MAKSDREPLGHWSTLVEGLQASPQDCYAAIEEALRRKEIPGAQTSRVTYKEGGFMSADRIYLRVSRKMLGFDICAAPFGKGFFFSWWQQQLPPSNFVGCLAMFLLFGAAGGLLRAVMESKEQAGTPLGLFGTLGLGALLLFFVVALTALCIRGGYLFSEDAILDLPLVGSLYAFFSPPTFYKHDTTDMYQRTVHAAVLEAVDSLMSAQGLRTLAPEDRRPTLRGPLA